MAYQSIITLVIFLSIVSSILANCPSGCICSSNIIVCTCRGRDSNILNLEPFHSIDYINDVYIHTCDTVKIAADTFASLSILKEFTITDVNHLWIESFAFREMHKYPDKMTFKNVRMDMIPADAFAGLSRTEHLWFINITAGVIHENAFRYTNKIEYVYFRESTIDVLETAAFAHMKNIAHLFIRGDCKINHAHDHLFNGSRIEEVIFEKCTINKLSAYAFCGAERLNKLLINNSTVLQTDLVSLKYNFHPIASAGKFEILTTNFDTFSLMPWSNVQEIEFDTCRIEMLMPLRDIIPLTNVTQIQFKRTLVNYITDHSLSRINVTYLVFEQCSIDTIHYQAFTGCNIDYMSLFNARIVQFNPNAFTNASIHWFIIDGTIMYYGVHTSAFAFLNSSKILISGSNISNLDPNAFSDLKTIEFTIENSEISNFSTGALMYLTSDYANISANNFHQHFTHDAFKSFMTLKLDFRYNAIGCDCIAEESMSLMNRRSGRGINKWNIVDNHCTTPTVCPPTTVIPQIINKITKTLMCQREYGYIVDCWCISLAKVNLRIQDTSGSPFNKNVVGIRFRDCSSLYIHRGALDKFRSLTMLHIQNISNVQLDSNSLNGVSAQLREISIGGSHMTALDSGLFRGMKQLQTLTIGQASSIDKISVGTFDAASIQVIHIDTSKIGLIESGFIQNSIIGNMSITNSHIGKIRNRAFYDTEIDYMDIRGSHIESMDDQAWFGLQHTRICFAGNKIACDCDLKAASYVSFAITRCGGPMTLCHSPAQYRLKSLDDVLQQSETELRALASACSDAQIRIQPAEISSSGTQSSVTNTRDSRLCAFLILWYISCLIKNIV